MGVLDFLFQGSPPRSVTTYGSTVENLPVWMSDYTQGLIARANAVAAEPYQPYSGPRIAGLNADQRQAHSNVRQNQGSWSPFMSSAGALTQAAGGTNITGAAEPYFAAAARTLPGSVSEYMDPFVGNVINRATLEAGRLYDEKLAPSLTGQFAGAGQYGSSAHLRAANQGARDITEGLQSQALGALSQAYQTAGSQFQSDAARQAELGQAAGNLATQQGNLQLQSGQQMGALGEALQALQARDAAALEAVGTVQQGQDQRSLDLAHQDYLNQLNYPRQQTSWLSDIIRGIQTPTATTTTNTEPATVYQPSGLAQLASLYTGFQGLNAATKARGGRVRGYAKGGKVKKARGGAIRFERINGTLQQVS